MPKVYTPLYTKEQLLELHQHCAATPFGDIGVMYTNLLKFAELDHVLSYVHPWKLSRYSKKSIVASWDKPVDQGARLGGEGLCAVVNQYWQHKVNLSPMNFAGCALESLNAKFAGKSSCFPVYVEGTEYTAVGQFYQHVQKWSYSTAYGRARHAYLKWVREATIACIHEISKCIVMHEALTKYLELTHDTGNGLCFNVYKELVRVQSLRVSTVRVDPKLFFRQSALKEWYMDWPERDTAHSDYPVGGIQEYGGYALNRNPRRRELAVYIQGKLAERVRNIGSDHYYENITGVAVP